MPTKIVFLLRFGALGLLLVFLLASSVANAQRAVVFDGSFAQADTFTVDLGDPSPLSMGIGGLTCLGTSHVSPGGDTTPSPQTSAVLPATFGSGNALRSYVAGRPPLPPLSIDGLVDDCDVVNDFAQVQAYLNQVLLDAAARVTSMDQCMVGVEQAYCDFVATVEAAEVVQNNVVFDTLGSYFWGRSVCNSLGAFLWSDYCERQRDKVVDEIPSYFDDLDMELAFCEAVREDLIAARATIPAELDQFDYPDWLEWADAQLAAAQDNYDCVQDLNADLTSTVASIDLPSAQAGCDSCDDLTSTINRPIWESSIFFDVGADSGILLGVASIFAATATTVPDVDLAARYGLLAQNLGNIPAERVLRIRLPNDGPGEVIVLGLRSQALADDGLSPLAVLLRFVPVPVGTSANRVDRRVLRDGWRALSRAVDPGATMPDLDDDDGDGVRDLFETQTGVFASSVDTGTSSDLLDSDGDRFTDGAEIFAGTAPNDRFSNPLTALSALPALGAPALVLLAAGLLALGAARVRGRRRDRKVDG